MITLLLFPCPGCVPLVCLCLKQHTQTAAQSTIKINSLTAKTLKDVDGGAVASGDITNGSICFVYYDGTDFLSAQC